MQYTSQGGKNGDKATVKRVLSDVTIYGIDVPGNKEWNAMEQLLGLFQVLLFEAIERLGEKAYGAHIATQLNVAEAQVYMALGRAKRRKLITVVRSESKGRGRPRLVYVLTHAGADALRSTRRRLDASGTSNAD